MSWALGQNVPPLVFLNENFLWILRLTKPYLDSGVRVSNREQPDIAGEVL
jgi:hypothetical protein